MRHNVCSDLGKLKLQHSRGIAPPCTTPHRPLVTTYPSSDKILPMTSQVMMSILHLLGDNRYDLASHCCHTDFPGPAKFILQLEHSGYRHAHHPHVIDDCIILDKERRGGAKSRAIFGECRADSHMAFQGQVPRWELFALSEEMLAIRRSQIQKI